MSINLENTVAAIGQSIKSLHNSTNKSILDFSNNIKINDGTLHKLGEYFSTIEEAQLAFPGVPIVEAGIKLGVWSDVSVAWAAAWLASISDSLSIYVPHGRYIFNVPLILRKPSQIWETAKNGHLIFGNNSGNINTVFEFVGSGAPFKKVLTRRSFIGGPLDAGDAPMSACVQIEAVFVKFAPFVLISHDSNPATNPVAGTINYLDNDPDWDIGIFVGCRLGVDLTNAGVLGHFRVANLYVDVTRAVLLTELMGWDGIRHNAGDNSGVDGLRLDNISLSGGRWHYTMLGAEFKTGLKSYGWDYTSNVTVTFTENPAPLDFIKFGSIKFIFGTGSDTLNNYYVDIEATLALTLLNLRSVVLDKVEAELGDAVFKSAEYLFFSDSVICVNNALITSSFSTIFYVDTNAPSRITYPSSTPVTQADPALFYDEPTNTYVKDGRGGYGASDVLGIGMFCAHSLYANKQRVHADVLNDNMVVDGHVGVGLSAGSAYIDVAAANRSRRGQGQRYISCRFSSFDAFIVRLGRAARITFTDCHTEPGGSGDIKDTTGSITTNRFGSYTTDEQTWSINLVNCNTKPNVLFFKVYNSGTNIISPNTGSTDFGSTVTVARNLVVGTQRNALARLNSIDLLGGQQQGLYFKESLANPVVNLSLEYTPSKEAHINYRDSNGVSRQLVRYLYRDLSSTLEWGLNTGNLGVIAFNGGVSLESRSGEAVIRAQTTGYLRIATSTDILSWDSTSLKASRSLTPASGLTTIHLGDTALPWQNAFMRNLFIRPPTSITLTVNNEIGFEYPSNTVLRIRAKDSIGTDRVFQLPLSGTGSPESAKTAPVGTLYTRTDGGPGTTLYVKESGVGNTGWVAK